MSIIVKPYSPLCRNWSLVLALFLVLSCPIAVNGLKNPPNGPFQGPRSAEASLTTRRKALGTITIPLAALTAPTVTETAAAATSITNIPMLLAGRTLSKLWLAPPEKKTTLDHDVALDGVIVMLHESKHSMTKLAVDLLHWHHKYSSKQKDGLPRSLAVVSVACDNESPCSIATAMDALVAKENVFGDIGCYITEHCKFAILGHGLGGTMAMWTALRTLLPPAFKSTSIPISSIGDTATPRFFVPSVAVSMNGPLDLQWALEQNHINTPLPWVDNNDAFEFRWRSPIDVLPPATRSQRAREASLLGRNLFPPSSLLGIIHGEQDRVIPVAHSVRFTVAACVGGVEVDLHRIKQENHFDCLNPNSDSWRVTKSILQQGWASMSSSTPMMQKEEMVGTQEMRPTQREETDSEVIIRTRRKVQLYSQG